MTTSAIQQKGLPKDEFAHIKGDSLVSQTWGYTPCTDVRNVMSGPTPRPLRLLEGPEAPRQLRALLRERGLAAALQPLLKECAPTRRFLF